MVRYTILACMVVLVQALFSQERPGTIYVDAFTPDYILKILEEQPNVHSVAAAYQAYYLKHPYSKNTYTQYYKRWMHWARKHQDQNGNIREIDYSNTDELKNYLLKSRNSHSRSRAAQWKFVGPNQTYDLDGKTVVTWQTNIYTLDVAPSDPNVLYAGGETGGIWKTVDKGLHWHLLTANILHGSIGAVRIHPQNHDTVYAGTSGKLIKTTDGGKTWASVYAEGGIFAHDIAIKSSNPSVVLAATNRGLLISSDAGRNWRKAFGQEAWTVKFKVDDPNTIYTIRQNGAAAEFLQSADNGNNWTSRAANFYRPATGVTVTGALIAPCPTNGRKLYAFLCGQGPNLHGYIGVFVSHDAGLTWTNTNPNNAIGAPYSIPSHTNLMTHDGLMGFDQGFYDMAIVVNPFDDNELIAGGTSWFKSVDGGKNWTALGSYVGGLPWSHPDIQCLAAVGHDLWIASDGGIDYSPNFGRSIEARMNGISGADLWGFDSGWNDDILVGGRYHNGNMAWFERFPAGKFYRMGGAEAATGYVSPSAERKTYFSDIGGYRLNGEFSQGVSYFPVALFPNESYAYYQASPMAWHPNCWNEIYFGNANVLWKSSDGGYSFQELYRFPGTRDNLVFEVEISRSNPNVMYVSQWDGRDDAVWKSTDGGRTFELMAPLPLPNNNDRIKMSLSNENPDHIWVIVTYGSNGRKVYFSNDGAKNWINWTTSRLDNITVSDVLCQYGTDGGVYIGSNRGVFYRNFSMSDWQDYSHGLPLSAETNRLRPFYRDGKLRNGCWGFGVWETELFEKSRVQAKIMADKLHSLCLRDTFYFDDHSVVDHRHASWEWEFEDAAYASAKNQRQVKCVFTSEGTKRVIMKLTTPSGTYSDTLHVTQQNECALDSLPGNALSLNGTDASASIAPLHLNSHSITMMAWVKPNGIQSHFAGLFFCRGGNTVAGLSVLSNYELRYHWNDNHWNWSSRSHIAANEWTHVALVVQANRVIIYNNGNPTVHTVANNVEEFDAPLYIGADPGGGNRYFKGKIDEFAVYNRALSQEQIREIMNLTKTHTDNADLVCYHQFNKYPGQLVDNFGNFHGQLNGGAQLVPSTAPVGPGYSQRLAMQASGSYNFGERVGIKIVTANAGVFPNGEVVITRLIAQPAIVPDSKPIAPSYWILRNYGTNKTFSAFSEIHCKHLGFIHSAAVPRDYHLFKRSAYADLESWIFVDSCNQLVTGEFGEAILNEVRLASDGQLVFTKTFQDTSINTFVVEDAHPVAFDVSVLPNPAGKHQQLRLACNTEETVRASLYHIQGQKIREWEFKNSLSWPIEGLPAGTYLILVETKSQMKIKRWVVQD